MQCLILPILEIYYNYVIRYFNPLYFYIIFHCSNIKYYVSTCEYTNNIKIFNEIKNISKCEKYKIHIHVSLIK